MATQNQKNTVPDLGNIYLSGFMCSGKTTAGAALARALHRPFFDSDLLLRKNAAAAALIREKGLRAFRKIEGEHVKKLAAGRGLVIALGGGVYPSRRWRGLFKKTGITVFLSCPWPQLKARLEAGRAGRPLLDGPWKTTALRAKKLYSARLRFYRCADITINTAGLTPAQTAEKIKKALFRHSGISAETRRPLRRVFI